MSVMAFTDSPKKVVVVDMAPKSQVTILKFQIQSTTAFNAVALVGLGRRIHRFELEGEGGAFVLFAFDIQP